MADNTTFNASQIELDWLIMRQSGMTCQSHTHLYHMLAVYNVVSTFLSVVLATPYFYNVIGLGKIYAAKPFKRLWQKIRRQKTHQPPGQDVVNSDITTKTLILSTAGSVIIALTAPLLTAISLWTKHRQNVNLWVIVQQWSTRPRATCPVFLINALMGNVNFNGKPQGFVITAMTTLLGEVILCLLGIGFLKSQMRHTVEYPSNATFESGIPVQTYHFKDLFDEMESDASSLYSAITVWAGILGAMIVIIVLIFLLLYYLSKDQTDDTDQTDNEMPKIIWVIMAVVLWFPSSVIYYFSWLLWHDFLILTPDDAYCVEDSRSIALIYCLLLPVALASWRAIATIASKRLPVKRSNAKDGKSKGKKSQDREEIELARRNSKKVQPLQDIESLEVQSGLQQSTYSDQNETLEVRKEVGNNQNTTLNLKVADCRETLAADDYLCRERLERHFVQDRLLRSHTLW